MTDKFAPGPWSTFDGYDEDEPEYTVEGNGVTLAFIRSGTRNPDPKATADLMAAGPTMLAALIAADEALELEGYEKDGQYRKTILEAIALARGKAWAMKC